MHSLVQLPGVIPDALPPAPSLGAIRTAVEKRIAAIARALLHVRRDAQFLGRAWQHDADDAVTLYPACTGAVHVHAAGAERLSCALASENALIMEAAALRELVEALDLYVCGGSAIQGGGEDPLATRDAYGPDSLGAPSSLDASGGDDLDYGCWLQRYLLALHVQLLAAERRGDFSAAAALRQEHDVLEPRARRSTAAAHASAAEQWGLRRASALRGRSGRFRRSA